jgi:hypothetical protein
VQHFRPLCSAGAFLEDLNDTEESQSRPEKVRGDRKKSASGQALEEIKRQGEQAQASAVNSAAEINLNMGAPQGFSWGNGDKSFLNYLRGALGYLPRVPSARYRHTTWGFVEKSDVKRLLAIFALLALLLFYIYDLFWGP